MRVRHRQNGMEFNAEILTEPYSYTTEKGVLTGQAGDYLLWSDAWAAEYGYPMAPAAFNAEFEVIG
jgi:hypothetical protein